MKNLKLSIAALAFMLTAGASFAINNSTDELLPCKLSPSSPTADTEYDPTVCQGSPVSICCYDEVTNEPIFRPTLD